MTNSRNKGASAERDVAKILHAELGINFKRDLEQTREADHGDLIADDDAWPFIIEVKHYATGWDCKAAWEVQAHKAAAAARKHPAVVYRYNGQKWRARIYMPAICEALGASTQLNGAYFDTSLQHFAYIAREIMAGRAA